MIKEPFKEGLTFDDLLLEPGYSEVLPSEADISTRLSRNIQINCPFVSAAMDTVTLSATAIVMARHGGLGVIHRNLSPERQAAEVEMVKKSENGMITHPEVVFPWQTVKDVLDLMGRYRISGVPVIKGPEDRKLLGIVTNRDLRFMTEKDWKLKVEEVMTKDDLVTVTAPNITLEEAKAKLHQNRKEKLLVVDDSFNLKGLYTIKDIEKTEQYPKASKDLLGRLRVGA
ncbi:MAG: IMP dehydrogenase, partial [Deltaproteobacteria bacterium]|nr:IMP dehydrogenase [Deltaproteobacteria bacterium]